MSTTDKILASAQLILAHLIVMGFLVILGALIFFGPDIKPAALTLITTMLTVLGSLATVAVQFFFMRQRPDASGANPSPTAPGATDVPVTPLVPTPAAPAVAQPGSGSLPAFSTGGRP